MLQIDHIICPVDLTAQSARALAYAAAWARWYGASLRVVHVAPIHVASAPLAGMAVMLEPRPLAEVRRDVEKFVAASIPPDSVTIDVLEGDPPAHIRQIAARHRHAIVVIGANERSRVERFVLGSVAERVLADSPAPVLLVPPHDARSPESTVTCKHIVCAVDLLPSSLEALRYALSLAREADATLDVLHVVDDAPGGLTAHYQVPEYLRHRAQQAIETMRAYVPDAEREACVIRERVEIGEPAAKILEAAGESGADVVVMGAGDRAHLRSLWLAPTIGEVARAVMCPILMVPLPAVVGRTLALGGRLVDPRDWRTFLDGVSLRHLGHPVSLTEIVPGEAEPEARQLPLLGLTLEGAPRSALVLMLGSPGGAYLSHTIERPAEIRVEERQTHGLTRLFVRSELGSETLIELTRPRSA